jgi:hypothetical protein
MREQHVGPALDAATEVVQFHGFGEGNHAAVGQKREEAPPGVEMACENVAGDRLQVLIAVGRIVSGGGGGPKSREDFGGENLFQHGTNAGPGKRRGTQGLIGIPRGNVFGISLTRPIYFSVVAGCLIIAFIIVFIWNDPAGAGTAIGNFFHDVGSFFSDLFNKFADFITSWSSDSK